MLLQVFYGMSKEVYGSWIIIFVRWFVDCDDDMIGINYFMKNVMIAEC